MEGTDEKDLEQCAPKPIDELPGFVKRHMQEIKQNNGISTRELHIRMTSGALRYAGIIVDCPGNTLLCYIGFFILNANQVLLLAHKAQVMLLQSRNLRNMLRI